MISKKPDKNTFFSQPEKLPGWGKNLIPMYNFLLENCFDSQKKYEIAEVGVFCGQSALHLCSGLRDRNVEYNIKLVDMWDSDGWHEWMDWCESNLFYGTWQDTLKQMLDEHDIIAKLQMVKTRHLFEEYGYDSYTDMIKDIFAINGFVDNLEFMNRGSFGASLSFDDNFFDMIMIDGAHDRWSVERDLRDWTRKAKPGGFVCGDDFNMDSVREPVLEHFGLPVLSSKEFTEKTKNDYVWEFGSGGVTTFCVFKK